MGYFPGEKRKTKKQQLSWYPLGPKAKRIWSSVVFLEHVLLSALFPLFAKVLRNGKAGTGRLQAISPDSPEPTLGCAFYPTAVSASL